MASGNVRVVASDRRSQRQNREARGGATRGPRPRRARRAEETQADEAEPRSETGAARLQEAARARRSASAAGTATRPVVPALQSLGTCANAVAPGGRVSDASECRSRCRCDTSRSSPRSGSGSIRMLPSGKSLMLPSLRYVAFPLRWNVAPRSSRTGVLRMDNGMRSPPPPVSANTTSSWFVVSN